MKLENNLSFSLSYKESVQDKLAKIDGKLYKVQISTQYLEFSLKSTLFGSDELQKQAAEWQALADKLMQNAKAPTTQDEAIEAISENGFFGIKQTSKRLADFVILGAKDNLDLLQAGREGIINGFKEAEKLWGEKLPQISYQTLENGLDLIDQHIKKLGFNILDTKG